MRLAAHTRICLLGCALLAVAGCGAASTAQSTAKPTVRIISPIRGAKLSTQTVTVHLSISHFTLIPGPAGLEQAGSGQVWVYANGRIESRLGSATATLGLRPGTYTLKAVLVTNGRAVASSSPIVVSIMPASTPSTSTSGGLPPISCATSPVPSSGLKAGTITLFCKGLPSDTYPGHLVAGADGNLWFTTLGANGSGVIGRITPSGAITVFSQGLLAGSGVGNLVRGPDGNLWFSVYSTSANGPRGIGRITPSGVITVFNSQALAAGGGAGNLVTGPDGNLWFTVDSTSANGTGAIGRITPSGHITVFTKGLPVGSFVGGLIVGPGATLWLAVSNGGDAQAATFTAIGRITMSGGISLFTKGLPLSQNLVLAQGTGGNLWFEETGNSAGSPISIGRVSAPGVITMLTKGLWAGPTAIVAGSAGDLWFTESGVPSVSNGVHSDFPGAIGRMTPSGTITLFSKGLLPVSNEFGRIVVGSDGNLWFTDLGSSTELQAGIGRMTPSRSITMFTRGLPTGSRVGDLVVGPDGNLWFTDGGAIGRIVP